MTFEPDIIDTIKSTASDYLQKYNKLPTFVLLSCDEFKAYEEERRSGRLPRVKHKGKEVILSVRRVS